MSRASTGLGYIRKTRVGKYIEADLVNGQPMWYCLTGTTSDMTGLAANTYNITTDGTTALKIPAGHTVEHIELRIITTPTSGGACNLSFGTNGTGKSAIFQAAAAVATFAASDYMRFTSEVADHTTVSASVDETCTYTLSNTATAGEIMVYYWCKAPVP